MKSSAPVIMKFSNVNSIRVSKMAAIKLDQETSRKVQTAFFSVLRLNLGVLFFIIPTFVYIANIVIYLQSNNKKPNNYV
nr:MAG TPA: hypothetical protein [Caudoviricetes sp.]